MSILKSQPSHNIASFFLSLCLFVVGVAVFWPGVSGGFLFDDYHNIVTNAHVQIKELTPEALWRAANAYSGGTRQLAMVSFALNAYWAGLDPWAYKVTGLLIHALNSVLVFWLVLRIFSFGLVIAPKNQIWAAAAVGFLWGLHPIQVSSALYIVQRMEMLCFTFLFIALLLYLYARQQQITKGNSHLGWWLGLILAWGLAWLCKENAVLLPLFFLGLEVTVLQSAAAVRPEQQRFWQKIYTVVSVLGLLVFAFWAWPNYYTAQPYPGRDFNTTERLLTQARVLWLYVQQILLPVPSNLYFYYDNFPLSKSWLQPVSTLAACLAWLFTFMLAVLVRRRLPLVSLGVFWFLSAHFLTSNIIGLEMVFEHRNYFALLGCVLILVEFISRLPVRDGPGIKYFAVSVLVVGVGFLGGVRAAMWGNTLLLATDMVAKNPQSARAAMDLGVIYYEISGGEEESPFYQFAARIFNQAASLPSASAQADVNLILMSAGNKLPEDVLNVEFIWKRYLEKLQSLHLGVETRTSVWSLLQERVKGKDLNDKNLQKALNIIIDRENQPDYRMAQVANYYLTIIHDEEKAKKYYEISIQKAYKVKNQKLVDTIIASVMQEGHPTLAAHLVLMNK